MKKLIFFMISMILFNISHGALAQTSQEKEQFKIIEREIKLLESELKSYQREFDKQKKVEVYQLKRELREAEKLSYPKRNKDAGSVAFALQVKDSLLSKIDSIESVNSNLDIEYKLEQIFNMRQKREEMIEIWTSPDRNVPREMSRYTKGRRERANTIRRQELVLSKIESNLNSAISPISNESGYKVIFDNQYSLRTTFILTGIDGGQRLAVSMAPKSKEVHYLIPGIYYVEYYISGRKLDKVDKLTIDGEIHYYNGEACYNFAYNDRY